jgi:class 3 adenylate cyclase
MGQARVERRLAAILAADVAGYSRLMGTDEEGTLVALKACRRELIDPKIADGHKSEGCPLMKKSELSVWWTNGGNVELIKQVGSSGVAALGCDPFKDRDVPVIKTSRKALRSRQRRYDLRMSDRCCERRKIGTIVFSVRPHWIFRFWDHVWQ